MNDDLEDPDFDLLMTMVEDMNREGHNTENVCLWEERDGMYD